VALIKEFCGEDEDVHVLEDISFTTDHKFENHCRSPPWRQILGDIAYIEVKPHDEDPFFITASTTGYFVNKVTQYVIFVKCIGILVLLYVD